MGGVDKFDQMIKYYPIKRKTNRWTNGFKMHIIQILIHNAYVLYKEFFHGAKLDHFDFHCLFIDYLLKASISVENSSIKQFHIPIKSEKRSDCVECRKNGKRTTTYCKCKKCDVYLCIYGCFAQHHKWEPENISDSSSD